MMNNVLLGTWRVLSLHLPKPSTLPNANAQQRQPAAAPSLSSTEQCRTQPINLFWSLLFIACGLLGASPVYAEEIGGLSYALGMPESGQAMVTGLAEGNTEKVIDIPATVVLGDVEYKVTSIGTGAFAGNLLTSVTIPDTVTSIGSIAFLDNLLESVTIPGSVTSIGNDTFGFNKLTSVTIPDSVTSIGGGAFRSNQLESVTIPDSVTNIGFSAFQNNQLTRVDFLGDHSEEFSEKAFFISTGIATINACQGSEGWVGISFEILPDIDLEVTLVPCDINIDGLIYELVEDDTGNVAATVLGRSADPENTATDIPKTVTLNGVIYFVTHIGIDAFRGNKLTSVTIPDGVTSIGSGAFAENQLESVAIPDRVTSIGYAAFYNNKLTSVTIPDKVTSIGDYAFEANQLESVTIPGNVTSIGKRAFRNNQLTSVAFLGDYSEDFNEEAFLGNTSLATINACKGSEGWDNRSFFNGDDSVEVDLVYCSFEVGELSYILVEDDTDTIPATVLGRSGSSDEAAIVIGETVTLNGVIYPVTHIGINAFRGNKLTSVTIPDSVKSIGAGAFAGNQLESVTIPGNVTSIGAQGFFNNNLKRVIILDGMISIGGAAFQDNQLESVTIPGSVTSIGVDAFCRNKLTSVSIPASVTTIGGRAFCDIPSASFLGDYSAGFNERAFYGNPDLTVEACNDDTNWNGVSFLTAATEAGSGDVEVAVSSCTPVNDFKNIGGLSYELVAGVDTLEYYKKNVGGNMSRCVDCHAGSQLSPGGFVADSSSDFYSQNHFVLASYIDAGNGQKLMSTLTSTSHTAGLVLTPGSPEAIALQTFIGLENGNEAAAIVLGRDSNSDSTDINIPDTVTSSDGQYRVTSIKDEAFNGVALDSVVIGDNVQSIGRAAFLRTNLTKLTIGASVTSIGNAAFRQTSKGAGITQLNIPSLVTSIGPYAFCGHSLSSASIPESVTSIGEQAFCDIAKVTFLGAYNSALNSSAFYGNPDLTVEACNDNGGWDEVSFLTAATGSGDVEVEVTYCNSVLISRIANAAENNAITQLSIDDLTAIVGLNNIDLDNIDAYLAAISTSSGSDLDTLTEIQALVDGVNANSGSGEGGNGDTAGVRNDVNADGKGDILWRNSQDGRNALWIMNDMSIAQVAIINQVSDQGWQIVGRGDFNGDSQSDVLWRNSNTGGNRVWLMDGTTVTSNLAINVVADVNWQIQSVNDFDGDGKDDILWRNMQTGNVYMYLMNGHEIRSRQSLRTVADLHWEIVTTADVNGDNKADLIWRNNASGTNIVWLMDGLQLTSNYVLNTIDVTWDIVGAGDINGDGSDDIIWRNQIDGRNFGHLMQNGQVQTSQLINIVSEQNWQITDILDLNGDGKDDLFWRNKASGLTYIYLMNGIAIQQRGTVRTLDTDWQNIH